MNFSRKKKFTIKKKTTSSFTNGEWKPTFTIRPSKKIKDVPAIRQGTNIPVKTRNDLKEIVEEPCLKACQHLFDKNIETLDSGCNGENCSHCAYIVINYDTLDTQNQQIADNLINGNSVTFIPKSDVCIRNYFNQIFIKIPTSPEENVCLVEQKLLNITQHFMPQRKIVKKMDPAQIIAMHMRAQSINNSH